MNMPAEFGFRPATLAAVDTAGRSNLSLGGALSQECRAGRDGAPAGRPSPRRRTGPPTRVPVPPPAPNRRLERMSRRWGKVELDGIAPPPARKKSPRRESRGLSRRRRSDDSTATVLSSIAVADQRWTGGFQDEMSRDAARR